MLFFGVKKKNATVIIVSLDFLPRYREYKKPEFSFLTAD